MNKLGIALRKCAPDEHACRQESNPNRSSLRGFESQKHPRRFLWSVGIASAWVEDLIYNSSRLSQYQLAERGFRLLSSPRAQGGGYDTGRVRLSSTNISQGSH